jgi:hypothetical protein
MTDAFIAHSLAERAHSPTNADMLRDATLAELNWARRICDVPAAAAAIRAELKKRLEANHATD